MKLFAKHDIMVCYDFPGSTMQIHFRKEYFNDVKKFIEELKRDNMCISVTILKTQSFEIDLSPLYPTPTAAQDIASALAKIQPGMELNVVLKWNLQETSITQTKKHPFKEGEI